MAAFRRDPYLWIHLAGLATVPLWLDVCLAGLAVGEPILSPWLELGVLIALGTGPVLWMQWQKPFYIFSLFLVAVRPDKLSYLRRKLLHAQKMWFSKLLISLGALALGFALWALYPLAAVITDLPILGGQPRWVGLLLCASAFLCANLFTQVPATVVAILVSSAQSIEAATPYPVDSILREFTVAGLRIPQLLPEFAAVSRDPASVQFSPVADDSLRVIPAPHDSAGSDHDGPPSDVFSPEAEGVHMGTEPGAGSAKSEVAPGMLEAESAVEVEAVEVISLPQESATPPAEVSVESTEHQSSSLPEAVEEAEVRSDQALEVRTTERMDDETLSSKLADGDLNSNAVPGKDV